MIKQQYNIINLLVFCDLVNFRCKKRYTPHGKFIIGFYFSEISIYLKNYRYIHVPPVYFETEVYVTTKLYKNINCDMVNCQQKKMYILVCDITVRSTLVVDYNICADNRIRGRQRTVSMFMINVYLIRLFIEKY